MAIIILVKSGSMHANELLNQYVSFNILHKILLTLVIAIAVAGLFMGLNRPFPLIILALVYFILGCERVSVFTYKVAGFFTQILIVGLTGIIFIDSLEILYLCFEHASIRTFFTHRVEASAKGFISIGLEGLVTCYAILLCWRAYERNKCKY